MQDNFDRDHYINCAVHNTAAAARQCESFSECEIYSSIYKLSLSVQAVAAGMQSIDWANTDPVKAAELATCFGNCAAIAAVEAERIVANGDAVDISYPCFALASAAFDIASTAFNIWQNLEEVVGDGESDSDYEAVVAFRASIRKASDDARKCYMNIYNIWKQ